MKKTFVVGAVVVALIGAGAAYALLQQHDQADQLTLYGNVDIRQVSLAFDGSDRVAEMRVDAGDKVKAGQVLAVLDTRTTKLKLAEAQAQADALQQNWQALKNGNRVQDINQAAAQAAASKAEADRLSLQLGRLENTATSTQGQAVSKLDLDNARQQLSAARAQFDAAQQHWQLLRAGPRQEDIAKADAQWRAAQADVALLQHQLELSQLKAPSNAVIRARLLEPGDMGSPQKPAYTLALTQPKWVRTYVNETQLSRLHQGMAATVITDSAPGTALPGRVGFISSVAEFTPKSVQTEDLRTDLVYEVRVILDDAADTLRLGMPATVHIKLTPAAQGH